MKLISHIFAISSGIAIACLALVLPGCHKTENDQVKDSKEAQKKANNLESAPDEQAGSISTEQITLQQVDNLDWSNSEEAIELLNANTPNVMNGLTENSNSAAQEPYNHPAPPPSMLSWPDNTTHLQQAQLRNDGFDFDLSHIDLKQYEFHYDAAIKYGVYPVHDHYKNSEKQLQCTNDLPENFRGIVTIYGPPSGLPNSLNTTVKAGTPEVTGSLDRRLIQKVIRQHSGELRACYERELNRTKDISGRVVVQWTINPKGEVKKVSIVESTLNNKNVEQCITNSIRHWRFPAPKDGGEVDVKFPFTFSPMESKK